MKQAWFWPIYGDADEMVFPYTQRKDFKTLEGLLADWSADGVLLSDGASVYSKYAQRLASLTHAGCWSHTRREFERASLEVFLADPDVAIDTNHLERSLRLLPMGRRNWSFCWTELGAKHVGIIHSLLVTCRLQGVPRTPVWSMCSSASTSIPRIGWTKSRRDCGSSTSPTIP